MEIHRRLYTPQETAHVLDIDVNRLEKLSLMGILTPYVAGKYRMYSIDEVQEYKGGYQAGRSNDNRGA